MFFQIWQKYDPQGSEFISFSQLSDFVNDLEKPLRIPKPNDLKLISLKITLCENNLIHCSDILGSLGFFLFNNIFFQKYKFRSNLLKML